LPKALSILIILAVPFVTDTTQQTNMLKWCRSGIQEVTMSLLQKTDVYQGPNEKAERKHFGYGFVLALICVTLALVVASVMFPDAFAPSGEFSLVVGP
jgi:hypothetical protein